MASGYYTDPQGASPSPDRDVPNPRPSAQPDPLAFGLLSKFGEGQAVLAENIKHLKEAIEKQGAKLDKIEELKNEIVSLSKDIEYTRKDLNETVRKLDTVRTWVIAAGGVVALVAAFAPSLVLRVWPLPNPSAPQQINPPALPAPVPSARGRTNSN